MRFDRQSMKRCGFASLSDFAVLEVLRQQGPQPVKSLGEKVMLTSGSITTAVQRLEKKGLVQISNESEIEELVEKVLKENPKMLEQYKSGKDKLFGFFIGQVMKLSNGKANPKMVNETLKRKLSL
mgnify:CR=1 FL=1